MDADDFVLLLLADSALPTGAFVASSGLESFCAHGFQALFSSPQHALLHFVRQSLATFAHSTLPYVADTHRVVSAAKGCPGGDSPLRTLLGLDQLYDASTLNQVARRASTSQGVALLTLLSKGLSMPPINAHHSSNDASIPSQLPPHISSLVDEFKLLVRRQDTPGHLPVCWGILTAALDLSLDRAQYLHLFLHARGLLSASVRLGDIGPYRSQQLLLHIVRPLVAAETSRCAALRTGMLDIGDKTFDAVTDGPANTWPLGEVVGARHDSLYSRVFNS